MGIALFSGMDGVMKSASLAVGAYSAFFLRSVIGFLIISPVWLWMKPEWPKIEALKIHCVRGSVVAVMGWSFIFSLTRLPLAEAIALSFIAPLIALYLAAAILGEKVRKKAITAALIGFAGVLIIVGGKIGQELMTKEATLGLLALLFSAFLYAWNLILQRQQALLASPLEVSTFQNGIVASLLLLASPFLLIIPDTLRSWIDIISGALLGVGAGLFLTWSYKRAEAQILVPIEYTGFLWAALLGWLMFNEDLTFSTIIGATFIISGCVLAAQKGKAS